MPNSQYPVHSWIECIDAYKDPIAEYLPCPNCGLKPKVWVFDNGRSTACGCWNSKYDHFSIHAESIMSVIKRSSNGEDCTGYDPAALRDNWNHWAQTGGILFVHARYRTDGRW